MACTVLWVLSAMRLGIQAPTLTAPCPPAMQHRAVGPLPCSWDSHNIHPNISAPPCNRPPTNLAQRANNIPPPLPTPKLAHQPTHLSTHAPARPSTTLPRLSQRLQAVWWCCGAGATHAVPGQDHSGAAAAHAAGEEVTAQAQLPECKQTAAPFVLAAALSCLHALITKQQHRQHPACAV